MGKLRTVTTSNLTYLQAVFRIRDILLWIRIRIRGSMPLTNGSGSWIRILLLSSLTFKMPTKNYFSKKAFQLITFWEGTFTSFFKDEKSKRSHKTVGIKGFSCYFCLLTEGSGSGSIPLTNGSGCLQVRQGIALHCRCFELFFCIFSVEE